MWLSFDYPLLTIPDSIELSWKLSNFRTSSLFSCQFIMYTRQTQSTTHLDVRSTDLNLEHPTRSLELQKPTLSKTLLHSSIEDQKNAVKMRFRDKYPFNEPKELQINTVVSLVNGDNTFLLAGTGYGKSRVSELFFNMFSKVRKPVVLVLNPLDALGDNQLKIQIHLFISWTQGVN